MPLKPKKVIKESKNKKGTVTRNIKFTFDLDATIKEKKKDG